MMDEPGCNEPVGEMARDPRRCLGWRCLILLEEGWGEQGGVPEDREEYGKCGWEAPGPPEATRREVTNSTLPTLAEPSSMLSGRVQSRMHLAVSDRRQQH